MASDRDQVIALLRDLLEVNRAILRALSPGGASPRPTGAVADDRDLDSQYGDPEIRGKDPRRWTGATMRSRKFSECPPEYLDLLAESLDWQAGEAEKKGEVTSGGKPVGPYKRKDAARARGWAARIRAGKVQQSQPALAGPAFEEPGGAAPGFEQSDFTPSNWAE